MTARLERIQIGEFEAIALSNDLLRVVVVPEVGGKIVSFRSLRTGREWLWTNPRIPLRRVQPGATDFGEYDCGGWDEIFPTVSPCQVPNSAWGDRVLTDHGELWCRSWQIVAADCDSRRGVQLKLCVEDPALPFRFVRTLLLGPGTSPLVAKYELDKNRGDLPLPYIWAAHPLFSIWPGDRILIPSDTQLSTAYCAGIDPGAGAIPFAWPKIPRRNGTLVDLSRVPDLSAGYAVKLFARNAANGSVEIQSRAQDERLHIAFDPLEISHLGLWLNYGGWSGTGTEPYFNIGIEPTTAGHDSLATAMKVRDYTELKSATRTWSLKLTSPQPID